MLRRRLQTLANIVSMSRLVVQSAVNTNLNLVSSTHSSSFQQKQTSTISESSLSTSQADASAVSTAGVDAQVARQPKMHLQQNAKLQI